MIHFNRDSIISLSTFSFIIFDVLAYALSSGSRTGLELLSRRKKAMTEAWFVSTLKRLHEWSGH